MSRSDTKIPSCVFFRLPQVIALIPISKSAWWEGCREAWPSHNSLAS